MRALTNCTILVSLYLLVAATSAFSSTIAPVLTNTNYDAIGKHISYFREADKELSLNEAIAAYETSGFSHWHKAVLSFGIGTSPVWLRFSIENSSEHDAFRRLTIENSWLDLAQLYIIHDRTIIEQQSGDSLPFTQRTSNHRFLTFDHNYKPGLSVVYIRASTPDPMVLPIFFGDFEASAARDVFNGYSYGLLYGIIIALLLYNLSLFLSIRQPRYLFYVAYLSMFLLMNISYTGHGNLFFWHDMVSLQKWMNPLTVSMVAITGISFAFSFLNIRTLFPRLFFHTTIFCVLFAAMQILFLMLNMQATSVITAIAFVMFFSVFTLYCAVISFKRGHRDAIYYLIASIATLIGSAVTALTVFAVIPYSLLTYRAAEISVSLDAILLSIALAELFRRTQKEKALAQQLARVDMLTTLNNRRAFNEICAPLWHNAIRHDQELCIILLDIDKFKSINDTHGHAVGDLVLKEISHTLDNIVRDADVLARWGGEEFAIMLPQTSLDKAMTMAERIRASIARLKINTDTATIKTTVSLGVAQKSINTGSIDKLFTIADASLYQAKNSGRNKVCAI